MTGLSPADDLTAVQGMRGAGERAGDGTAEGVVRELLPSALVRVELDGGHEVTAHLAAPAHRNFVRVVVGDRVRVALMAHDHARGRVMEKL